jgi:glycosyltransferase involved in cell wall biosynthesis
MNHPKLSIITVVYNSVKSLEETILSVINQDFDNFEYIIIDGGSTDGTLEIIKKYQYRITLWISEPDEGIYDAMNKGIRLSKGKWVYFLGADDIFYNNLVLQNMSKLMFDTSKVYYGNVLFKSKNIIYDGAFDFFKIATRNICHQSILYCRQVFEEFNYNLRYKIYADYDLNLKLFNHKKIKFKYINLTIAIFNDNGLSGLKTLDQNFEDDRLQIIKKQLPYYAYIYRLIRTKISNFINLK